LKALLYSAPFTIVKNRGAYERGRISVFYHAWLPLTVVVAETDGGKRTNVEKRRRKDPCLFPELERTDGKKRI
jgi:hypothetical protein